MNVFFRIKVQTELFGLWIKRQEPPKGLKFGVYTFTLDTNYKFKQTRRKFQRLNSKETYTTSKGLSSAFVVCSTLIRNGTLHYRYYYYYYKAYDVIMTTAVRGGTYPSV